MTSRDYRDTDARPRTHHHCYHAGEDNTETFHASVRACSCTSYTVALLPVIVTFSKRGFPIRVTSPASTSSKCKGYYGVIAARLL